MMLAETVTPATAFQAAITKDEEDTLKSIQGKKTSYLNAGSVQNSQHKAHDHDKKKHGSSQAAGSDTEVTIQYDAEGNIIYESIKPILGTGIYTRLHKNIRVQKHPRISGQHGLFAIDTIPEGTIVWFDYTLGSGEGVMDISELKEFSPEEAATFDWWAFQISPTQWAYDKGWKNTRPFDEDASLLQNHSCDPSAWFADRHIMVARKTLHAGEEVTYDYSTSETTPGLVVLQSCCCGSEECRGTITGDAWKEEAMRRKYRGHFQPYIEELIDEDEAEEDT